MTVSVLLAAAIVTSGPGQAAGTVPRILFEGATIERTTAEGTTDRYEVVLNEGDYLELSVPQDQAIIALSAHAPDGTKIHAVDVPDIDPLPQHLMLVAATSGRYAIGVTVGPFDRSHVENPPARKTPRPALSRRYTLRVAALRPATASDRERARLFAILERAAVIERLGTMQSLRDALPLYQEAARGWRTVGDTLLEAATLMALAHMTAYFTQYHRDSIAAQERLTELYPQLGERWLDVHNLRALGQSYWEGGRLEDAKRVMTRARTLAMAGGFERSAAASVRDLGLYEFELGNYEPARELALQAQTLAAAIPNPSLEALTLSDLSRLDALAGDLATAIARSQHALDLAAGDLTTANRINLYLGFFHLGLGELDAAAARFEARLSTTKKIVQRDSEALAGLGLGDVLRARGDRPRARQRYEAAASVLERGAQHWRCIAEQRLGRMDLEEGHLDEAAARFERMGGIAGVIQNPECEAEARAGLADVAAARGDLDAADAEARRVVELTEIFRRATVSLEARSLGFGALAPAYERAIEISMRRAERDPEAVARAFALNEQALARGLLDRVAEARIEARARIPAALGAEARSLQQRWRARLAELQAATLRRPDAAETKALAEETQRLGPQLRDLEARLDVADARHATFLRPRPLTVEEVQALLDPDTVLLEYALGDARSYLWMVSPRDIRAFPLPARAEIEALARQVHQQLARPPATSTSPDARRAANRDRRALARLILDPAVPLLSARRLVVVLPGALSLVPFGALPIGPDGADALIARYEVVQVPSATTLAAMRRSPRRLAPLKRTAVFADPVFDAQDPRVARGRVSPTAQGAPPPSAPRAAGIALTRLPFSRAEAIAIASLAPESVATFVGLDAARERAAGRALAGYRFIHFATHGVVNQEVPSLSSVVLSLVDRAGRPRDGFLMLPDIYEMTLNADVVVLSGCQTALGKEVRGEGPIGLARAFMYAGVPRVVASLWPVDDLATSELMKRFYRGMLVKRLPPAAALRTAQRELAAMPRWRSPYFWAAFVLQGDWR